MKYKLAVLLVAVLCFCEASALAPSLRGFGRCEKENVRHGDVTEARFRTTSETGAETVAGKFLYDLSFQEGVSCEDGVWEIPGGNAYVVTFGGFGASIYSSASSAALREFLARRPDLVPVRQAKCPEWMKRFEWGVYGVSGLENIHGWMQAAGARDGEFLDPREDMNFLAQMGAMRFDAWLELAGFDDSDGIPSPTEYWKIKYADELGVPWSARFYMPVDGYNWATRRFAKHLEQPAPWMMNGWLRYACHQPHLSWYDPEPWCYFGRQSQRLMRAFDNGKVRGWMHPAGELVHQPWYDMHADYSPAAKVSWIDYLKAHGVTLAEASEMYSRDPQDAFVSWSQVDVPEFATFAGLPGLTLDLEGTWQTSADGTDWQSMQMPGNWEFLRFYGAYECDGAENRPEVRKARRMFRRSFDYAPDGKRTYLYFFPMNPDSGVRHILTLNGQSHAVGTWCGIDVTDALKAGTNELTIDLAGAFWNGRIFLSTQPPAIYPNLGKARNRMFTLWNDWRREAKAARCADIFAAMREVDPNAPIKFMAPIRFGTPTTDRLMSEWGAFAHFTGEGVWYFPWYKRYGKLYGYPGTSELAGPYSTVAEAERSTLRVFLAGLDMHEPVFLAQTYSRNPQLRDWWLKHKPLFRRLGRQDIWGPQVLIYRRSCAVLDEFPSPYPLQNADVRRVNSPWDWDLGRGSLQALGHSMLYIDDDGVEDGKMYGHQLIVDCGNEVIPDRQMAGLEKWVRDGGTYVAWPFSGRSNADESDNWPIARLAGAHVVKTRPLGGTVTFAADGGYFRGFAGKSFADDGRNIDSNGNNLNDCSFELASDGATVAATYENGAAAVTVRKLGKGSVIWFGSAFWRDASDKMGIWWPGAGETRFLAELLNASGFERPLIATDDRLVWTQPYRSNDGASLVGIVCNFHEQGVQTPVLRMRTSRRPTRVVTYGADGVRTRDFDFADGIVTVRLELPAQEVEVLQADVYAANDSVDYWWHENAEAWHELKTDRSVDFSKYDEGNWQDQTQDLKPHAFYTVSEPGKEWLLAGYDTTGWRSCVIDALQFWGLPDGAPAWVRKEFDLEHPDWLTSGSTRLVCASWAGPNFVSKGRMYLNGVEITRGFGTHGYLARDVSHMLRPRGNVLAFCFERPEAGNKFTGLCGAVYLTHRPPPMRSLDLPELPAMVNVPLSWKGKYRLVLNLSSDSGRVPLGVSCAGRFMRKHHHDFGNETDVDITALVSFGMDNRLEPLEDRKPQGGWRGVRARLDLFRENP